MKRIILFRLLLACVLASSLVFAGCGSDGSDGAAGADGVDGVPAHTAESCTICHTADKIADIDVAHPLLDEKPVVSDIIVARSAGDVLTVTFHVADTAGTPIPGIMLAPGDAGNIRVYMADIVPATTVTVNAPQTTWDTDFLEMWAEERGTTVGAVATDLGGGDYSFVMAATPATFATNAPEGDWATHTQRVYVRADARDIVGFNRTMGVADFTMPGGGADTGVITGTSRTIVTMEACTACHNDPLQEAAHGGGYQSPQVCNFCHSPIGSFDEGGLLLGDVMQSSEAWLASLIHKIHAAIDMPAFPNRILGNGYVDVTYPKNIKDCEVCHFDDGQDMADAWNTNPTAEVCTTCHDVTFTAPATHTGGPQADNSSCSVCHPPAAIILGHEVTDNKAPDATGNPVSITPVYTATISMTAPANGTHYVAGETPVVTVTTDAAGDYDSLDNTVDYTAANLYVYGPRALAVPVLTPSSTTDPDWDPAIAPPDQGRSMLASAAATDAMVLTDATGFMYQLQAIPADLEAGTYMVQVAIGHTSSRVTGSRSYKIDGWQLITFQIGDAAETLKVAGECAGCHTEEDWGSMYHRSYFGTDGCIACHDKSGNHADFLSNRTHAVHSATVEGDLLNNDWSHITFPQDIETCQACHSSGDDAYRTDPTIWSAACVGCHGDVPNAKDHMIQNGSLIFEAH